MVRGDQHFGGRQCAMSEFVEFVEQRLYPSCQAEECEEGDCEATLEDVDDGRVLISLDCEALGLNKESHADFVLATAGGILACIELKGGKLNKQPSQRRKAQRQLQASATFLQEKGGLGMRDVKFRAVLVHKREFGAALTRSWAARRIEFRGQQYPIRRVLCGESLAGGIR